MRRRRGARRARRAAQRGTIAARPKGSRRAALTAASSVLTLNVVEVYGWPPGGRARGATGRGRGRRTRGSRPDLCAGPPLVSLAGAMGGALAGSAGTATRRRGEKGWGGGGRRGASPVSTPSANRTRRGSERAWACQVPASRTRGGSWPVAEPAQEGEGGARARRVAAPRGGRGGMPLFIAAPCWAGAREGAGGVAAESGLCLRLRRLRLRAPAWQVW